MFISIDLQRLTRAERYILAKLVGPGDTVYIKKLRTLSVASLKSVLASPKFRGLSRAAAARAIAPEFQRHPKTITRHIRILGLVPGARSDLTAESPGG